MRASIKTPLGLAWLVVMSLAAMPFALATSFESLSLEQMMMRSELAFFATIAGSVVVDIDGEPWTEVTFEIQEALRGELGEELSLRFYGGQLANGVTVQVSGMPLFLLGEEVLILAYDRDYYSPIVGFTQGLWRLSALGFQDDSGRLLSFEEDQLSLDGVGADTEAVLEAMREALGEQP